MTRHYFDYASAWPLRPEAAIAWQHAAQIAWADPSRRHREAATAGALLEQATETVAEVIAATPDGIVWTGSGTEAIHLAVLGSARAARRRGEDRRHLVVSAVEHSAVLRAAERLRDEYGYSLDVAGVDGSGAVDADHLEALIRDDTLAVHLQHANHEVGTLQPTHEVAQACRRRGALLHVDACQTIGQIGVTLGQTGADLLSASAHKFGGPAGVGFLAIGERGRVAPLVEGDERQRGRRAGAVDIASCAAAAVALRVATDAMPSEHSRRELARRHLREALPARIRDVQVHGPLADAHPGIVAVSALYVDGEALLAQLDDAGFAVHSGSSCATTSGQPSHVLVAMGALTHGHVRIGIGPDTSIEVADRFVDTFAEVVTRLRAQSGMRPRGTAQHGAT